MSSGVFACTDADHFTLFPRVDLIVHHGGAGTTATALRSGVPQLIVPHIVDQFFHGRPIAELGIGPAPVPKAKLSASAIAAALTNRFEYRANAHRVRASLSMEGGARAAADELERLARGSASGSSSARERSTALRAEAGGSDRALFRQSVVAGLAQVGLELAFGARR